MGMRKQGCCLVPGFQAGNTRQGSQTRESKPPVEHCSGRSSSPLEMIPQIVCCNQAVWFDQSNEPSSGADRLAAGKTGDDRGWQKKVARFGLTSLALHQSQLFFHLRTADLRVPHSGLNGGGAARRDMPEIVGDLFQGPSRLTCSMGKIMAQIMKAQRRNQFPFFLIRLLLEHTKPGMNTVLGEVWAAL